MREDCIIIGGGLTGLSAANYLQAFGIRVQVFEARSHVGGRAMNYRIDGYACNQTFEPLFGARPTSPVIDHPQYTPLGEGLVIRGDDGPRHIDADPLPLAGLDDLQPATWMSGYRQPDLPWHQAIGQIQAAAAPRPPGDTAIPRFRATVVDPALACLTGTLDQTLPFNIVSDLALDWLTEKSLPRAGAGRPYLTLRSDLALMYNPRLDTTVTSIERDGPHDIIVHTTDSDIWTHAVVVAAGHLATLELAGHHPRATARETIWLHAAHAPTDSAALHLGWAEPGRVVNTAVVSNISEGYADQDHLIEATVLGPDPIDTGTLYADLSEIYQADATDWDIIARISEPEPATLEPVASPADTPEIVYAPYPLFTEGQAWQAGRRIADHLAVELGASRLTRFLHRHYRL